MYAAPNSFPLGSSIASYQSKNKTVAISPSNDDYSIKSTYFVRVVPNFALYDVLSNR